jgi:uncharacterized protein with HEPN domain
MTSKSPLTRLRHILDNIDGILAATRGRAAAEITESYVIRRAVERGVEIISEAAKALPPELRDREPDVPWKDIIGIGNMLRHEYYRIRDDRMLIIVSDHLPALRPAIVRLIATLDEM